MDTINTNSSLLCNATDSIFCVIDIQSRLVGSMPSKPVDRIIENTQKVLEVASILKVPVVVSEQSTHLLGGVVEEIVECLPEETTYIEKTSFSCCGEKAFLESLLASGRKQVILAGLESHISVLQTALHLKQKGFDVFILQDTTGSRYLDNYKNSLSRLLHAGITLSNSETLIFEWLRDLDHELLQTVLTQTELDDTVADRLT
jgi:nicotinamidase-related amidase